MKPLEFPPCCVALALALVAPAVAQGPPVRIESSGGVPYLLHWPTETGRSYYLYASDDLTDWNYVPAFPQAGTGGTMQYLFTAGSRGFFQTIAAPPPPAGMRLIPAGVFHMGNPMDANEGTDDELPVHDVAVSAFFIGEQEVTKALWDEVRTWGSTHGYTDLPAGSGKAASHPVHSVYWYDAVKWCNARSEKEGLPPCYTVAGATYRTGASDSVVCAFSAGMGYRLPTEAEWEKAARGWAAAKRFPVGNTVTHDLANYYASSCYGYDLSATEGFHPAFNDGVAPFTSPAGTFAANGYGIKDCAGNVFEWCWDWYSGTYYASSPGVDPRGPGTGSCRVFRGGAWDGFGDPRASYRGLAFPGFSNSDLGFRIALTAAP